MLESRFIEQDTVKDKHRTLTEAVSINVYDQACIIDSTAGAFAVTLPSVSEAKGKIYTFYMKTDGGNVTIQDRDDSPDWTDLTFTAVTDKAILYSDGMIWWVLASSTT